MFAPEAGSTTVERRSRGCAMPISRSHSSSLSTRSSVTTTGLLQPLQDANLAVASRG